MFPTITRIEPVLEAVEGRGEFVVAKREYGTVINYNVVLPDTFNIDVDNPMIGMLRREARGIIFDNDGNIMSRPFHKFFNLNERPETQLMNVDWDRKHKIYHKMDGSFVRPIVVDGRVNLGTKMGLTDIGYEASKLLDSVKATWLEEMFHEGYTPILEYIAPTNRIVVKYDHSDLVLLGIRKNDTGEYLDIDDFNSPLTKVEHYSESDDIESLVQEVRSDEENEGVVIAFEDGDRIKLKADTYVKIHKFLDCVHPTFHYVLVQAVIDGTIDDIKAGLADHDYIDQVNEVEKEFWKLFYIALRRLKLLGKIVDTEFGRDRKRVAQELVPTLAIKEDAPFLFHYLNGRDLQECLIMHCQKYGNGTNKWEKLKEHLRGY